MSTEPETQGHGAAQGARYAVENGNLARAIGTLAGGVWWTSDTLVKLERRLMALEVWAQERGYELPAPSEPDVDPGARW
jgi:hypothetical protein